ncbi:MAG: hypothetical protein M1821_008991 [Bathelium mastoideum]|nr:MAG: hypothetical protein M1821_008991 [Bathelium mastoideum]
MLVALTTAPALLGTQESIRQSQAKEKREEHRARRCNLVVSCIRSSRRSQEINGKQVVLKNGKLYVDTSTSDNDEPFGHPFAGYYLPYPDTKYEGLVTTITDEAPILNWCYVCQETYSVRYGVRLDAQPHLTGPWDCTRQDRRMTFEGWEGFVAVEETPGLWAVSFDRDDDGLRGKVLPGTRVLEIELLRREKRWKRDIEARKADQTTVHSAEETPAQAKEHKEAPKPEPIFREAGIVDEDQVLANAIQQSLDTLGASFDSLKATLKGGSDAESDTASSVTAISSPRKMRDLQIPSSRELDNEKTPTGPPQRSKSLFTTIARYQNEELAEPKTAFLSEDLRSKAERPEGKRSSSQPAPFPRVDLEDKKTAKSWWDLPMRARSASMKWFQSGEEKREPFSRQT